MSDDPTTASPSDTTGSPLNDTQYFIIWGISIFSCLLSLFGSSSIVYIASRKFRSSIYHRLLFIVSVIDITTIFWLMWNPILMNAETGYKLAIGNQATCTFVGFAILFSIVSKAFYSFYIALYFMLLVRYKWSEKRVMRYERLAYLIAFIVPMIFSLIGFTNEAFNSNEIRICTISSYPIDCSGSECIRGSLAPLLIILCTATIMLVSALAILCTVLLFLFVRHQTKQSLRHDFVVSTSSSVVGVYDTVQTKPSHDERNRLVRTQSILYVAANINNFLWLFLFNRLVLDSLTTENMDERNTIVFACAIVLLLFMPMYGFFNFCIYSYPRFRRMKKHFPKKSWWWCLRLLYTIDQGENEITARRSLQRQSNSRSNIRADPSLDAISFSNSQGFGSQKEHEQLESSVLNDVIHELAETQSIHNSDDKLTGL